MKKTLGRFGVLAGMTIAMTSWLGAGVAHAGPPSQQPVPQGSGSALVNNGGVDVGGRYATGP